MGSLPTAGMATILSAEKRQQVIALGRLGFRVIHKHVTVAEDARPHLRAGAPGGPAGTRRTTRGVPLAVRCRSRLGCTTSMRASAILIAFVTHSISASARTRTAKARSAV